MKLIFVTKTLDDDYIKKEDSKSFLGQLTKVHNGNWQFKPFGEMFYDLETLEQLVSEIKRRNNL